MVVRSPLLVMVSPAEGQRVVGSTPHESIFTSWTGPRSRSVRGSGAGEPGPRESGARESGARELGAREGGACDRDATVTGVAAGELSPSRSFVPSPPGPMVVISRPVRATAITPANSPRATITAVLRRVGGAGGGVRGPAGGWLSRGRHPGGGFECGTDTSRGLDR
ncbi:hypothetical protein [Streptomyces sp. NBC_01244]|uniref:hypothetical protein n=1 Tax=Streptomyces sp. NBC_01244 TaxID=2903797 RepID=UPI002E101CB6|nr:hypothetical protein OG247_14535 [Streptomyces sp. NBC_01244]